MTYPNSRPFVCDGSPYDCPIFVVGHNAATNLNQPFFQRYWSDDTGMLRETFEEDYAKTRSKKGVRPRLDAISEGANPAKCFETNLYSVPSKKAKQLTAKDRDSTLFEFLLRELKPKVVFLHSNSPIEFLANLVQCDIGDSPVAVTLGEHKFTVLGWSGPLYQRKMSDAADLGRNLGGLSR